MDLQGDEAFLTYQVYNEAIDTQPVDCHTLEPSSDKPLALSSPTGLKQNGSNYTLDWRPGRAFNGTCRAVTVRIPAAADGVAYFRFGAPRRMQRH